MTAYRTPAEMPEEPINMSENEMCVRNFKAAMITIAVIGLGICASRLASSIYSHWSDLEAVRVQSTEIAARAATARAAEARALADKAMFEKSVAR